MLQALRRGLALSDAAKLAGISRDTLRAWRANDVDFEAQCQVALAEMQLVLLERVDAASADPKRWQAAARRLERAFPEKYGRAHRLELTGKDGGPLSVDATTTTVDQWLDELSIDELSRLANLSPAEGG